MKSEILFLYESAYSIPNGDPFTGEQRYDEESKKILVSDVRIKRFIRDFLNYNGEEIYVIHDKTNSSKEGKEGKESGASARMKTLKQKYSKQTAREVLKQCIDVRLFGGISTEEKDSANLTGPVQFAMLNPSLNEVDLRMHQNTSVFPSSTKNSQGAIGTTTVVPYSINQIHGWVNPYSAKETNLSEEDLQLMFRALWESINNANTRTKSNQNSLLLLQIRYSDPTKKLYGLDQLIKIIPKDNKRGEQLRSSDDFDFDFTYLTEATNLEVVDEVQYYSDIKKIENQLKSVSKFKKMSFPEFRKKEAN